MDIAALSVAMSDYSVKQSAGIAITKIAMNASEQNAVNVRDMMSSISVDPNLGSKLDVKA